MRFEDVPFSDIEAQIFVSLGAWRNYEELEASFTLDELLLTSDALKQKIKTDFRMQAAIHQIDTSDWDDEDLDSDDSEGLPQELIEAERELKLKRELEEQEPDEVSGLKDSDGFGFGYTKN